MPKLCIHFVLFSLIILLSSSKCQVTQNSKNRNLLFFALISNSGAKSSNCNDRIFLDDSGTDPYYESQWHLHNSGEDLNIGTVWNTNRGEGIRVAVVDDGLDIYHEDLSVNNIPEASYNFVPGDFGYSTSISDPYSNNAYHGTAVAGVIAARDKNGRGLSGIAPRSCLVGYNVLANPTDANQGFAMSHAANYVFTSNNSWGATDATGKNSFASFLWKDSLEYGLLNGRNGKGTVYVWAAGNGANVDNSVSASGSSALYPNGSLETDNSNQDGQANFYGVISICGIMDNGKRVSYSEKGANLWVCGYSQKTTYSSTLDGIWTTDLSSSIGYNPLPSSYINAGHSQSKQLTNFNYSKIFNGTSGAAPMATATVALILKENPNLGWRDVKLILAESARKNDPFDSDWITNSGSKISSSGIPYNINHKYGFGVIDISRAVALAKTWTNVGNLKTYDTGIISVNTSFTNNTSLELGASNSISISNSNTSISKIEFIEVTLTTTNADASDLEVVLISPNGTQSILGEAHICSNSNSKPYSTTQVGRCGNYSGWTFGTARHLGESVIGSWTLRIADRRSGAGNYTGWGYGGVFASWGLKFYGRNE